MDRMDINDIGLEYIRKKTDEIWNAFRIDCKKIE